MTLLSAPKKIKKENKPALTENSPVRKAMTNERVKPACQCNLISL